MVLHVPKEGRLDTRRSPAFAFFFSGWAHAGDLSWRRLCRNQLFGFRKCEVLLGHLGIVRAELGVAGGSGEPVAFGCAIAIA